MARELVKLLESRFAREIAEEGAEALERRIATCLEQYGDDVASALRKVGPRVGLGAVERHGAPAAALLARYGDEGARLLATEGGAAARVAARFGDEGVGLMARSRGVAAPVIETFGDDGLRALRPLGSEGASRLSGLAPEIRASGRSAELLGVIEKFGDRACAFLWRNKGVIFGAAVLAAFLSDPEPYLNGVKEIAAVTIAPVAREAAKGADWTLVIVAAMVIVAIGIGLKLAMWRVARRAV